LEVLGLRYCVSIAIRRISAHVATAHFKALLVEHVAQHAAAGERIIHVQIVDAPHQKQVGSRDWPRPIVDRERLISSNSACQRMDNLCPGLIIALRSTGPL
jgi:hypothetical protein